MQQYKNNIFHLYPAAMAPFHSTVTTLSLHNLLFNTQYMHTVHVVLMHT